MEHCLLKRTTFYSIVKEYERLKNIKQEDIQIMKGKIGRPPYIEDKSLIKQLITKVNNGEITNCKAWEIAWLW